LNRSYNRTRVRTTQRGNKKAEKATKELLRFLYDGERVHYAVVDVLLARLAELILWLEKDARGEFLPFVLLKTTLLLAYDTAEPEAGEAIQVKVHNSSPHAHAHAHAHAPPQTCRDTHTRHRTRATAHARTRHSRQARQIMDFEHCKPKPASQEVHSLSFLNGKNDPS
jgi:hypothetical protein